MKTVLLFTAILTFAADAAVEEKANATTVVKDELPRPGPTPWIPFFGANSFPSFTLPGLGGLAHRPGLFGGNQQAVAPVIKATKTEYIEVTRRQTIHPVCYTMYENKSPCLPHRSIDGDDEPEMDVDVHHQVTLSSDIKEEVIHSETTDDMTSYMKPVQEVLTRGGKYIKFGNHPDKAKPVQLEASETRAPPLGLFGSRQTERAVTTTTTVLLTKLEKYTDHRVTATMVALNCLPVDPAIPRCRRYAVNPIVEVPLYGGIKKGNKNGGSIIITPVVKAKPRPKEGGDGSIEETVEAVKKAVRAELEGERRADDGHVDAEGDA